MIIPGKLMQQLTPAKFLMRILMADINHNSKISCNSFPYYEKKLHLKTGLFLLEELQA